MLEHKLSFTIPVLQKIQVDKKEKKVKLKKKSYITDDL